MKLKQMVGNHLMAWALLAAAAPVFGTVTGSYNVNGDGTITYSYIIDNSLGTFDVAAWSLEFGFPRPDWDPVDIPSGGEVTVPNSDWLGDAGIADSGHSAQDFLALAASADVEAGQSLLGFSFTSEFPPGLINYDEFSAAGDSISGTTIGPVLSAVPEGNGPLEAIALAGMATFAVCTRRFRRREEAPFTS